MSSDIDFSRKPGSRDGHRYKGRIRRGLHYYQNLYLKQDIVIKNPRVFGYNEYSLNLGFPEIPFPLTEKQIVSLQNSTNDDLYFWCPYSLKKKRRWERFSSAENILAEATPLRLTENVFYVDVVECIDQFVDFHATTYVFHSSEDDDDNIHVFRSRPRFGIDQGSLISNSRVSIGIPSKSDVLTLRYCVIHPSRNTDRCFRELKCPRDRWGEDEKRRKQKDRKFVDTRDF